MKAITLWQPWASLIAMDLKKYETRSWGTRYRGKLAIHAGKKVVDLSRTDSDRHILLMYSDGNYTKIMRDGCPIGSVIATVDLTDIILMDQAFIDSQLELEIAAGDWRVGRFAWKFENLRVFPEPILAKGHQGLWEWPGIVP